MKIAYEGWNPSANVVETAWLAGLIDGEGCITVNKQRPGSGGRVNVSYRLYLKITMCHEVTIRRILEITGVGAITTNIPKNPKRRQSWTWWASNRQAAMIIQEVRPFLVTKAHEADIALEWADAPLAPRGGPGGGKPVPPVLLAAREDIYQRLRAAKRIDYIDTLED